MVEDVLIRRITHSMPLKERMRIIIRGYVDINQR